MLFLLLSFEGPDQYSQAGGLGVRAKELARALALNGHDTHLFFIGDPALPAEETGENGRLHLHRWGQWISAQHPMGVYDGEWGKVDDWNRSLPQHLIAKYIQPALGRGERVVILGEEWHTAKSMTLLSHALHVRMLRDRVVLLWNANNIFGFDQISWPTLDSATTITTVSRYMKHLMWKEGVNPIVIPNGIPAASIKDPPTADVELLRGAAGGDQFLFKIGRFDPDKRWLMAMSAVAMLKVEGRRPRLLIRGGKEPHGVDVIRHAQLQGLVVEDIRGADSAAALAAVMQAHPAADVLNLVSFLPEELLGTIYRACDAVLANSGHEPFGLVGLEVMAAGGLAVTGSTGEDYAEPFRNAFVLETDDPLELAACLRLISRDPGLAARLRAEGRNTARAYTWDIVIEQLFARLELAAARQHVAWPDSTPPATTPAVPPVERRPRRSVPKA